MIVCQEMKKLRDILGERDIPWEDKSVDYPSVRDLWICRTHFSFKNRFVSVINGAGTYGGFCIEERANEGLLEMMVGNNEPMGHLTADEVFALLEKFT